MHKCLMSTQLEIRPPYLCNFIKNSFSRHSTFVLSTIEIYTAVTSRTDSVSNGVKSAKIQSKFSHCCL